MGAFQHYGLPYVDLHIRDVFLPKSGTPADPADGFLLKV